MINLRRWFVALTGWLIFLFNIERVVRDINLTKYTYLYVALVVIIILVPSMYRFSVWLYVLIPSILLVLIKYWAGENLAANIPVTITEICGLVITGVLSRQVSRYLYEFEEVASKIFVNYFGPDIASFESEQGIIYRELKRARVYKRPLSLVSVKLTPESLNEHVPQLLKEYQKTLANQMALSAVAKVLDDTLFDSDIIAGYRDSLIITIPELESTAQNKLVNRITQAVEKETGLILSIGAASYPEDAVTFEALLEAALDRMEKSGEQPPAKSNPAPQTS